MSAQKHILVAPLDWGLGHATRCIPVIRAIIARGAAVTIGGNGPHAELLKREFPDCPAIPLVNYAIRYARTPLMLALRFPGMLSRVSTCARVEHRQLHAILSAKKFDAVVSDQRFGFWSPKTRSVYITHQLCLKMPRGFSWLEPVFAAGLRSAAGRFNEVWIPDVKGLESLTGDLTGKYPLPARSRFIGPLSRFTTTPLAPGATPVDVLIMLSGPEPQRSILERRLLGQAWTFEGTVTVLPGRSPVVTDASLPANVRVLTNASSDEIGSLIRSSGAIVCRGGYTTIMELASLGKRAVLVPTPGQSEQEYLCGYLSGKGLFESRAQRSVDLREAVSTLHACAPVQTISVSTAALDEAVEGLLG